MLLEYAAKPPGRCIFPDREAPQWEIGRQRVVHADCQHALRELGDKTIDVIVTSPPYNIGVAYKTYQDRQPRDTYLEWLAGIGREVNRVIGMTRLFS